MITFSKPISDINYGIQQGVNVGKILSWHDSLNTGLKAYYPCDDLFNLNLRDTVGTKNGTLDNRILWGKEPVIKQQKYLRGTGANQVTFGNQVDYYGLGSTNQFTVTAWIYLPQYTASPAGLTILDMGYRSSSTNIDNAGLYFVLNNNRIYFRIRQRVASTTWGTGNRGIWATKQILPKQTWVFVAMMRDLRFGYYYSRYSNKENYEKQDMGVDSNLNTWQNLQYRILCLANNNVGLIYSDKGSLVTKIGVWDRVLKPQELSALYYNGIGMSKTNQFDNGTN
jgi:hypothetical protein